MRYDDVKRHVQEYFRDMVSQFKEELAADGPPGADKVAKIHARQRLTELDLDTFLSKQSHGGTAQGLVAAFCEKRGIAEAELTDRSREWLVQLIHTAHAAAVRASLDHVDSLGEFDLTDASLLAVSYDPAAPYQDAASVPGKSIAEAAAIYFDEIRRTAPVEPKTELDRREVLELLGEITGHKNVTAINKSDAQEIKRVLMRLPWNRNKMAATRGKTLADMLAIVGVRTISPRRVATHLGNLHAFFKWAVANGYAAVNVFEGMQVKAAKTPRDERRGSFSAEQLQAMFRHLTQNPDGLVRRDVHKWGTLIAMFSGMRVNEVAQLDLADIKQDGEVWYFDITKVGDERKSLKNQASQRRLPMHKRLLECGLLEYIAAQREGGHKRLFHELSYSEMNHYGRNLGRWVNESFLPALDIKSSLLTCHSFRHTMATRLAQADAPERHVPAVMGHRQAGMTYSTYFREGFLPVQLKASIDMFDF
ncbi:MAG: site-specific integrase [Tabrizicola sp.]|uniref:site-specific integrase n=1 Tax=Tabrizicola sp. TaxID=2005166 RepID=UPI002AB9E3D3|nr:site-specific integrase [Tabrizicola sp.]MDZ4086953.1 site-specific integrase [Tabrizicola sp.]